MSNEDILSRFNSLPPEGQRQVIDFLAFLQKRYAFSQPPEEQGSIELAGEGFIGMWQDREDMQDSTAWVRSARVREWIK